MVIATAEKWLLGRHRGGWKVLLKLWFLGWSP
jgi:hypothetical protein